MRHLLYVIGEPGSGKSALVEALTANATATEYTAPFAATIYDTEPPVIELGRRRANFPGTDALALNVQPKIQAWLASAKGHVLAEGDRLANARFFDFVLENGWKLVIARIRVKPETAAERREQRETRQDETWVESRRTKVDRLGAMYPELTINVWHENGGTEDALTRLRERSPVAAAFP